MSGIHIPFEFRIAPEGRHVAHWTMDPTRHANIALIDLDEIFGPIGAKSPMEIVNHHRAALEAAARRSAKRSGAGRHDDPVTVTRQDFEG